MRDSSDLANGMTLAVMSRTTARGTERGGGAGPSRARRSSRKPGIDRTGRSVPPVRPVGLAGLQPETLLFGETGDKRPCA